MSKTPPLVAIVDDEECVCRALHRLLRAAGFGVLMFGSGAAFLESLGSGRPDCLVLDVHMPGMSGFDVQARLRELGETLPVVVLTGHDTPQHRNRAIEGGASAYLRKPADDRTLLDAVAVALEEANG